MNVAGARLRRWAGRARVVGERAVVTAGDAGTSALRAARGARGAATLPERTWRAADVHVPDAAAALPLPAAAALRRALTGVRVPSLDAFSLLGPRPADAPAVYSLDIRIDGDSRDNAALHADLARARWDLGTIWSWIKAGMPDPPGPGEMPDYIDLTKHQ